MDSALAGALLGAVLGVLGAYVFDIRKAARERADRVSDQQRERRTHRATVATTIISDLRRLEFELHEVFDTEQASRIAVARKGLFFDVLQAEVRWFAPDSIQLIAEFFRRVDHLYTAYTVIRAAEGGALQSTPRREYELRSHAAFALQALPDALAALKNEGGVQTQSREWAPVTFPTLPTIPEPLFEETRTRREAISRRGV